MKHIGRVSKALPAPAYLVPRNIFAISDWTDIVVVIGLTLEKFFGFWTGRLIPADLRDQVADDNL
ncbi:MAG: hypothetical protein SGI88_19150 [Candidatus Hydrogenedentes bacterium]|nr:hypothetical protein [Candidatus Hydrogenedentota bacterium]